MIDLKLVQGDLSITEFDSDDESNQTTYDLSLLDEEDSISRLVRRALETPFAYIGQYIIDARGISNLDGDFGNAIYRELSENININFISRARNHVSSALSFISSEIELLDLRIEIPDMYTVQITATYSIRGQVLTTSTAIPI